MAWRRKNTAGSRLAALALLGLGGRASDAEVRAAYEAKSSPLKRKLLRARTVAEKDACRRDLLTLVSARKLLLPERGGGGPDGPAPYSASELVRQLELLPSPLPDRERALAFLCLPCNTTDGEIRAACRERDRVLARRLAQATEDSRLRLLRRARARLRILRDSLLPERPPAHEPEVAMEVPPVETAPAPVESETPHASEDEAPPPAFIALDGIDIEDSAPLPTGADEFDDDPPTDEFLRPRMTPEPGERVPAPPHGASLEEITRGYRERVRPLRARMLLATDADARRISIEAIRAVRRERDRALRALHARAPMFSADAAEALLDLDTTEFDRRTGFTDDPA